MWATTGAPNKGGGSEEVTGTLRSPMGEVRAKARLINAGDEALVRRGMLRPEQIRTYEADALIDTRC
jgi:hypothetical protein